MEREQLTLRVPPGRELELLKQEAVRDGRSLNGLILNILFTHARTKLAMMESIGGKLVASGRFKPALRPVRSTRILRKRR